MMRTVFTILLIGLATVALAAGAPAASETMRIPASGGGQIEIEIRLPAEFDPAEAHSVMVSPGDFYWGDGPPQPGWIVVASDAFYERNRLELSPQVLAWVRRSYKVRGRMPWIAASS